MLKADAETLDTESVFFSDFSNKSVKSYSNKEFSKGSTPESTRSLSNVNKTAIDLSVYAVPEVGVLKNKTKYKVNLLGTINEAEE